MMDSVKRYKIILASGSPRRKELMELLGLDFEVISTNTDENFPDELVRAEIAVYLAEKKAANFKDLNKSSIAITADTIVCLEDEVLNKPANKKEAISMLQKLSGKCHEVITGICMRNVNKSISFSATTKVFFRQLTHEEINYYVDHFKPFDKAGGYGIQEWIGLVGIEKIEGSYFNVVGLPVFEVYQALRDF